jgi:hypothetical protein
MPIHLTCQCGARVIAPSKRAGQSIRCPKCDARIPVPPEKGAAPATERKSSRLEAAISDLLTARSADLSASKSNKPPAAAPQTSPSSVALPKSVSAPVSEPPSLSSAPATPIAAPIPTPRSPDSPSFSPSAAPQAPATPPTIRIDNDDDDDAPQARSIQIVTTSQTPRVDKSWLGAVYGLALLWSALALVGLTIAGLESYAYYRAEELWRLQRWAFLAIAASTLQLALAVYLVQLADWMACRAAAVVISCIAAIEAMFLAVTLFSRRDSWFARFLDLAPHLQSGRALGVALLLTLLSVLLAYTTASVSLAWQRDEQRMLRARRFP